nr:Transketolase, pyrimidine binding domain protein [uncultured bacterium]
MTYSEAINEALDIEMGLDETVVLFGEDVAGGAGSPGEDDAWGGSFAVTGGLLAKYPGRVLDTPISEAAIVGAAAGAAVSGLKPIGEVMFSDFMTICADQLVNQAAKFRYMFGGKVNTPMVIRSTYGAGQQTAAQHSQTNYGMFAGVPGLKVVVPATPHDVKGLLIEAIQDPDPVAFFEHKLLYDEQRGEVPEGRYTIPFGEADIAREGDDVTVVAIGRMRVLALEAAAALADEGIECEVIDPRTISPLDEDTIFDGVESTSRLVVVDEGTPYCGMAADIVARVTVNCFDFLDASPRMVTAPHSPVPFSPELERLYLPDAAKIADAVRATVGKKAAAAS